MTTRIKILLLFTLFSLPVAACGVKPGSVEPPQGADEDQFPKTYPAE